MALVPNWITLAKRVSAMEDNSALCEAIVKDGSNLWGAFIELGAPSFDNVRGWYKSTDNGATWVDQGLNVGGASPSNPPKSYHFRRVLVVRNRIVHYLAASVDDTQIWWSTFDLDNPTNPWTDWTGLFSNEYTSSLVSEGTLWAGVRPSDNALILAFQSVDLGPFAQMIRIKKYDGSSWTELGQVGGGTTIAVLHSGVIDSITSHTHIFFNYLEDTGVDSIPDLCHVAVNSSDDSVTSIHTIENSIEGDFSYGSYIHGPGAVNGTTIAFGYGKDVQTNAYASSTYGTFKVAIGDMSGDPLNPSWTLTTVNSTPDLSLDFEDFTWVPCGVAYAGSTLHAYYVTPYPAALSGPYPSNWNLWKSTYSGSWSTPEKWYDPSADTNLDAYRSGTDLDAVANFQLVTGFTNGVGIMVDVGKKYAGYEGPASRANNYVSAGGPMVARGKYASA